MAGQPRFPLRINKPAMGGWKALLNGSKEQQLNKAGLSCGKFPEAKPILDQGGCENYIFNDNNAHIILGRDRVSTKDTGYGGMGRPTAASIHLIAGMKGYMASEWDSDKGVKANPDPQLDAAFLYLSQKTDVDENYNLAHGSSGFSRTKSAGIIKADAVRLVGRENIKLITGCCFKKERNSQDGDIVSITGIDIIAGNKDSLLEPMVKGDALAEGLQELVEIVQDVVSQIHHLDVLFMLMARVSSMHTHGYVAGFVAPDPMLMLANTIIEGLNIKTVVIPNLLSVANLSTWEINYTKPFGGKYINSRWNYVN
tara:strand:+ start:258 stop:1193 length:936 start_codon:yes stop_codon:yes gene_type:complete